MDGRPGRADRWRHGSATSSDITTYNDFVQQQAYGTTYNGVVVNWKALASTPTIAARDNVGGFGDSVPVYLPSGTKLANDLTATSGGLWSGTWLTFADQHIDGTSVGSDVPWTGSNNDGSKSTGFELGGSSGASATGSTGAASSPINLNNYLQGYPIFGLWGVSEQLTAVAVTSVPEIDPAGMGSVLALLGGGLGLLERRRKRA